MLSSKTGIAPACNVLNGERMFRQRLRSFFEKTPAIHYIKQHETVVIGEIVVDVKNIMLRPYACDGAHCLSMRSLPNHLEDYGFTFYNEVAAYGDCCRGPIVFISQAERQHIAEHLEGILPHMSQEGQFVKVHTRLIDGPSLRIEIEDQGELIKDMSRVFLSSIWNRTENALRDVDHIIFCGYSLPDADMHIKYLLKRAQTNRSGPLQFAVINDFPGKSDNMRADEETRFKRFLGSGVNYTALSFQDFANDPLASL